MTPQQFLVFAQTLPEPALLVCADGTIVAANARAADQLNLPMGDLSERSLRLCQCVAEPRERVMAYLRLCSSSRQMMIGTLHFNVAHGESSAYRCEGALLASDGRDACDLPLIMLRLRHRESASSRFIMLNRRLDAMSREMRLRQRAEDQRAELLRREQQARAEAERLNRLKDEFLSILSHELRTPLNAILGWAQILRRFTPDAATIEQGLETIETSAQAQARLVDDLLDMSRILMGKFKLEPLSVDLVAVAHAALETVRHSAEHKEIALRLNTAHHALMVSGDAVRLRQVIWNLLSNAVKFTPRGGRVQLDIALDPGANGFAEVCVSDSGQGIAEDFLPFVFDRFRQADSSMTRAAGGLGLGLAIVRQIVELHGGAVAAESKGLGCGSVFRVRLPTLQAASGDVAIHDPEVCEDQTLPDLTGISALVVDDEVPSRNMICRLLAAQGAIPIPAASAQDGLNLLRLHGDSVQIIISDIGMPGQDGYHFLRSVRRLPESSGGRVPAIALTAYTREEDRMQAYIAGFARHVSKPIDVRHMLRTVAELTGGAGSEKNTEVANPAGS